MGTRADFYVGRGPKAEWLGSVAWDGHPEGFKRLLKAKSEKAWRNAVAKEIAGRDDGTTPDMGWPWPWDDSQTTDYAYAFDDGAAWGSCFGSGWFDPRKPEPDYDNLKEKGATFPNMKERAKPTLGRRSGVLVLSR